MPPPRRPTGRDQPTPPAAPALELEQLRERVRTLEADKGRLQDELESLRNGRLRLTPEALVRSLRTALEGMRQELAAPADAPVEYTVSGFDVDLKAGVEADEAGVKFRLPDAPGPAGETLSTVRFSIRAVPKPRQ